MTRLPTTPSTTKRTAREADDDLAKVDPDQAADASVVPTQLDNDPPEEDRSGLGVLLLGGGVGLSALAAGASGPASAAGAWPALPVIGGPQERPSGGLSPEERPAPAVLGLQVFAAGSLPDGTPTTRDGTVRVQGLESGATWSYSFDGGVTWQPGSGDRIPGDEAMKAGGEGRKTLQVRQTDEAGNHGTAQLVFDLDRTAPERVTLRLKHDTGRSDSDLVTSDPTVVVDGMEAGAVLRVRIHKGAWFELQGNEIPAARFEQLQGFFAVDVLQVDRAGNAGLSRSLLLTLDTVAPPAPQLDLVGLAGIGGGGAVLPV